MSIRNIADGLGVSRQILAADLPAIAQQGYRTIICNRPDGEASDQPVFEEIRAAAESVGVRAVYLPVTPGAVTDGNVREFTEALAELPSPVLAYCRTGTRSVTLWSRSNAARLGVEKVARAARDAGYDMSAVLRMPVDADGPSRQYDVVVVGAGAGGLAVASSLLRRAPDLDVAIIDPADVHYYQPGWTLVGSGVFTPGDTVRTMASVMPSGAHWLKAAVASFSPGLNEVVLDGCRRIAYRQLVVTPGLKLDWNGIEGLAETLGRNGVTSNYRFDLAPYTFELVSSLDSGRALFTQPPMPIKCAGAPQKAMYLSADHWQRRGVLGQVDIEFLSAGGVLFGVKAYVPALMEYVERYGIDLTLGHRLVAVDGPGRVARFETTDTDGQTALVERPFDMLHVCPPQSAPDFIRVSPLADRSGWLDVDQTTLVHRRHSNIHGLGDVINAPNAKTAAAARKQAPVVAENVLHGLDNRCAVAHYDGYGSCPLTVEQGRVVLAEFGYGGKLLPTFPRWLVDGTRPSQMAWWLKEKAMPSIYWRLMLKGHEWLAQPEVSN